MNVKELKMTKLGNFQFKQINGFLAGLEFQHITNHLRKCFFFSPKMCIISGFTLKQDMSINAIISCDTLRH